MKVRTLGCSGAIARGNRTTSFLVDQDILIDAGTGVGDLEYERMTAIGDVFLTHAHFDHVACLPLLIDAVSRFRMGRRPVHVYGLPETLDAVRDHIFNGIIWPDFIHVPSREDPLVRLMPMRVGETVNVGRREIKMLSASHSIPACGYAVRERRERPSKWWVFSGDTRYNPPFWRQINHLNVGVLVIETAFSNRERVLAEASGHLSPETLAMQLGMIACERRYPIYITHTKPTETGTIMREVQRFDREYAHLCEAHEIRWLSVNHIFEL